MSKQTAVEWLVDKIEKNVHHTIKIPNEYFEQAKAMEKEQIQDAYWEGGRDVQTNVYKGMKEYYNERYGGKQ
jgi:HEPN domain-containing protein